MPGLIPLMLNPVAAGKRSSVIFAPSPQPKRHSRGQSISNLPLPAVSLQASTFPSTASPALPQRSSLPAPPRPKAAKRLSLASPSSPPALPMLPYSTDDWRRTVAEVKRQHANRRYRACFTRCNEILDNIKETANVEPAYLISLHFYAATALEICARPLNAPSAYRDSLFRQARSHYDQATDLIQSAEESTFLKNRASFISSSPTPYSPSGSVSSRAWTSETGFSSPTPSLCSSEDLNARLRQSLSPSPPPSILALSPRSSTQKKVSFELPKETARLEPYIRPDSPTLGFDDEYFVTGFARQELPQVPVRTKSPEPLVIERSVEEEDVTPRASRDFFQMGRPGSNMDITSIRGSFLMDASASRYCAHLTSLKTQLIRHRANLDALLEMPAVAGSESSYRCPTPVDDEMHLLERRARIERLRKSGWQRKRFDPTRYEVLRNAALAELN